ncbi:DUF2799 domain-containing protein [Pseudoalteromonas sp. BZB3]|uniref:DUF2799 domain-containing protein n=1 Tax=Pseudoalteromonas sp. BZB3 TaxID=3136670 RepID=UPI0032C49141|tara:strand:+ start:4386 stop:4829 length:444 start_codon:yes stop_codon:yes gene_type:complete
MKKIILFLLLSLLIGCQSTTTEIACNASETEWYEFGQQAAVSGKSVRIFDSYKQQCSEQLIQTAQTHYIDGFTDGLMTYCTYDNGFERGKKGLELNTICPLEMRAEFEKGFKIAKRIRDEEMKQAEHALRERERYIQQRDNAPPEKK